jgi:hypothetical protein
MIFVKVIGQSESANLIAVTINDCFSWMEDMHCLFHDRGLLSSLLVSLHHKRA